MTENKEVINRSLAEITEKRSLEVFESIITTFNDLPTDSSTLHSAILHLRESAMTNGYVVAAQTSVVELQEKIQKACDNIHSTLLEPASRQRGDEWRFKASVLKELSYVVGALECIAEIIRKEVI